MGASWGAIACVIWAAILLSAQMVWQTNRVIRAIWEANELAARARAEKMRKRGELP